MSLFNKRYMLQDRFFSRIEELALNLLVVVTCAVLFCLIVAIVMIVK